jgi:putative salt-induced outer membrane protein
LQRQKLFYHGFAFYAEWISAVKKNLLGSMILGINALGAIPAFSAESWGGEGQLGFVLARGNSDADTVNAKLEMAKETASWKNAFGFAALRASSEGDRNAERYAASWQTDYRFSPRSYWYGGARYEDDRFSGFDYQASLVTGLGHRFVDEEDFKLFGQAGLGFRRLESALTGLAEDNVIFSGELRYEQKLTDTTSLKNKLIVEAGEANTFLSNELALQVKINTRLSLAAGLGVRHNTDPPSGRDKTDTLTTLNLVYGF